MIRDEDPYSAHQTLFTSVDEIEIQVNLYFFTEMLRFRARLKPVCGDGIRAGREECDVADAPTCFGRCQLDCTCGPVCGDGAVNHAGEQCDGADDSACPGACTPSCTCAGDPCGNGIVDEDEECDGGEGCGRPGEAFSCQHCLGPGEGGAGDNDSHRCCDGGSCIAIQARICLCPPFCFQPADRAPASGGQCCSNRSVTGPDGVPYCL